MKRVFIDGSAGTTGLRIHERLSARTDLTLLTLPEERRKDPAARADMLAHADLAFLCLPDAAAREAIELLGGADTVILDTSTAHRTAPGWVYAFPEVSPALRAALPEARRIAVPGCHASGFIALVRPLVDAGILPKTARLTAHSLTGYSGGGKKMIADYEAAERDPLLDAPRQYGLTQAHKHLPEMQALTGLDRAPHFSPIVADFYSGMEVTVPLFGEDLNAGFGIADIREVLRATYTGPVVRYVEGDDGDNMLSAGALSGLDGMQISVHGNEARFSLVARYDNLGKGASGAAVQAMNIVLGAPETTGLIL